MGSLKLDVRIWTGFSWLRFVSRQGVFVNFLVPFKARDLLISGVAVGFSG